MPRGDAPVASPDSPVVRYLHRGDVVTSCIEAIARTQSGPAYRKCGRGGHVWRIVRGGQAPRRMDLGHLAGLRRTWGVSVHSLVYRCRELGLISDATASRTYQRLRALDGQPGFAPEPVSGYPGEQPVLLSQAFDLAVQETGLGVRELAQELAWPLARVRELLGMPDSRPVLRLV
ncbi:hypothetical protein ACFW5I_27670 [Streptomyces sp. NPDC058818]|uniref:hypothetical protein n=1 Tax=Streptomyces sp. NPDC058818 TaxID=3346640 RepID=UPI0036ADA044